MAESFRELVFHWGEAYIIVHPAPDVWAAQRRDNRETLLAETPGGLRDRILADYLARPVGRDAAR